MCFDVEGFCYSEPDAPGEMRTLVRRASSDHLYVVTKDGIAPRAGSYRREREIVGTQIIGYMFSEVFARVDSGPKEREQLLLDNADAIANQAE